MAAMAATAGSLAFIGSISAKGGVLQSFGSS